MASVARPAAYPVSYQTVDGDLEKGGTVEADMDISMNIARQGFIRKTLGILSVQLLVTGAIALAISAWPPLTRFAAAPTSPLPMFAAVASLVLVLVLSFSERARHEHPLNLMVLGGFTLAEAVLVGAICAQYTLPSVLLAFAATGAASAAVAGWASTAKKDLTMHGGALLGALFAFLSVSILALLLRVRLAETAMAAVGAVLFAAYLAVDVQMLFDNQAGGSNGGLPLARRERAFGADEHVAAALAVYLDVINLLVYLLRLFGERRE